MASKAEDFNIKDIERRMEGALASLRAEFSGLRTGRASPQLLEPIMVDAYGSTVPITQVGAISVPEARMLAVNVWDRSMVTAVEKAIRNAGIGLNPITDGQTLRVPIPPLNEERRRELAKLAARYAEQARVAVRNVRRDGMELLKKLEKDGVISQDQQKKSSDQVQSATDAFVKKVDEALKAKEEEIMQV
jgi:ribosome recycling factor